MAASTVVPLLDGLAGVVDRCAIGRGRDGDSHHDLAVGRLDEADPQPVDLGQAVAGRPPSVSTRISSRSASKPNQTACEQPRASPGPSSRARCRSGSGRR